MLLSAVLGYLAAVLALGAAASKVLAARGTARNASLYYLVGALAAFGIGVAICTPTTLIWLGHIQPWLGVWARMVAHAILMAGGFCMIAMLIHFDKPPDAAARRVHWHSALCVAGITAMGLALLAIEPNLVQELTPTYARNPYAWIYQGIFLGYLSLAMIRFTWYMRSHVRALPTFRLMRVGLRTDVASAVVGLVLVAWKLVNMANLALGGQAFSERELVTQVLVVTAIILLALGTTVTGWGRRVVEMARRREVHTALRLIDPLWKRVAAVLPQISLCGLVDDRDDPAYALYRRVIEIRDAQLLLRPYVHPRLPEWITEITAQWGISSGTRPLIREAAELSVALDAFAVGRRYCTEPLEPLTRISGGPDTTDESVDEIAEARWLARVGTAQTHPVVTALRHRAALDYTPTATAD